MKDLKSKDFLNNAETIMDDLLLECDKNKYLILLLEDVSVKLSIKNNNDAVSKLIILIEILKKNNNHNNKLLTKLFHNLVSID